MNKLLIVFGNEQQRFSELACAFWKLKRRKRRGRQGGIANEAEREKSSTLELAQVFQRAVWTSTCFEPAPVGRLVPFGTCKEGTAKASKKELQPLLTSPTKRKLSSTAISYTVPNLPPVSPRSFYLC
ncbi:MAG: hypothetical protein WKF89_02985 [Chitinophagaceae bacterium]